MSDVTDVTDDTTTLQSQSSAEGSQTEEGMEIEEEEEEASITSQQSTVEDPPATIVSGSDNVKIDEKRPSEPAPTADEGLPEPLENGPEEGEITDPGDAGDAVLGADEVPKTNERVTNKNILPELEDKFRPAEVERLAEKTVKEHLDGLPYDAEEMPRLIKVLTDTIQIRVKALNYKRYKILTHVVLGEKRGEGVSSVARCVWDPMADCMATYRYLSETVFCTVNVYGIYFY